MNLENLRMLERAIEHLGPLLDEVVFVGGATVELWVTDQAAPEFRPTDDVDLIVTKLEAFAARGNQDFLSSRDFSDVVTLIDGREELVQEVAGAPARLQSYVGKELLQLASHRDFNRGLEGALPSSPESQARVDRVVLPRIRQLMTPAEGALME